MKRTVLTVTLVLLAASIAWADRIITEDAAGALLLETGTDTLVTERDAGAGPPPGTLNLLGAGI